MKPPRYVVTVDLVLFTIRAGRLQVLLVQRGVEPFLGSWALPGGLVEPDEDLPAAARRELEEETAVSLAAAHLEQLASYGDPDRDPRGRTVTVAYLGLIPDLPAPVGGSDAAAARWFGVDEVPPLAFDHAVILADGLERARAKLEYSPLGAAFCPPEFTVADLRAVYEAVWGVGLDPRNFHRKVTGAPGFLVPVGRLSDAGPGRPAQVFRRGEAATLNPPITRAGLPRQGAARPAQAPDSTPR